ncbi:MAG: GNAT family N-acetyltransferase [Ilumatobacteraceae bacterium]
MSSSSPFGHPSMPSLSGLRLYGKRVMMRPLAVGDFDAFSEVRVRNERWLVPWEPTRAARAADPTRSRDAFASRCAARDRERQAGTAFGFGVFVDQAFAGEINLNNVIRGALQSGTVGYWIDRARAGNGYIAEGVVVLCRFAFDELHLHRLEICIVPRNTNSRRVMEKLELREEGVALRYLEINGAWEDHMRFAITTEEWQQRRHDLTSAWIS